MNKIILNKIHALTIPIAVLSLNTNAAITHTSGTAAGTVYDFTYDTLDVVSGTVSATNNTITQSVLTRNVTQTNIASGSTITYSAAGAVGTRYAYRSISNVYADNDLIINAGGTVSQGTADFAISSEGFDDYVQNSGTVTGNVYISGVSNIFDNNSITTLTGNVTVDNGATFNNNASSSITGNIILNSSSEINVNNATITGDVTLNSSSNININNLGDVTGTITVNSAGTRVIASGTSNLDSMVLNSSSVAQLGTAPSDLITINGNVTGNGSLNISNGTTTLANSTLSDATTTTTLSANTILNITGTTSSVADISGTTATIEHSGTGNLTGAVTLNTGSNLNISNTGSATGTININDSTATLSSNASNIGAVNGNAGSTLSINVTSGNTVTLDGGVSNVGTINITSGIAEISSGQDITGITTFNNNSQFNVTGTASSAPTMGTNSILGINSGGVITIPNGDNSTFIFNPSTVGTYTLTQALSGYTDIVTNQGVANINSSPLTIISNFTNRATTNINSNINVATLIDVESGELNLNASLNGSGNIDVTGRVNINTGGSINTSGTLNIQAAGRLDFNDSTTFNTISGLTNSGQINLTGIGSDITIGPITNITSTGSIDIQNDTTTFNTIGTITASDITVGSTGNTNFNDITSLNIDNLQIQTNSSAVFNSGTTTDLQTLLTLNASAILNNQGAMTISGNVSSSTAPNPSINNNGTLNITSDIGTINSIFDINNGQTSTATLNMNSDISCDTLNNQSNGTLVVNGNHSLNANTYTNSGVHSTSVTNATTYDVLNCPGCDIDMSGGQIQITGQTSVTGITYGTSINLDFIIGANSVIGPSNSFAPNTNSIFAVYEERITPSTIGLRARRKTYEEVADSDKAKIAAKALDSIIRVSTPLDMASLIENINLANSKEEHTQNMEMLLPKYLDSTHIDNTNNVNLNQIALRIASLTDKEIYSASDRNEHGFWLRPIINYSSLKGSENTEGYSSVQTGFVVGLDSGNINYNNVGVALGFNSTSTKNNSTHYRGTMSKTFQGMIYGTYYYLQNSYLDIIASHSILKNRSLRRVVIQDFDSTAYARFEGKTDSLILKWNKKYYIDQDTTFTTTKHIGAHYNQIDGYNEFGGMGINLDVPKYNKALIDLGLGARVNFPIRFPNNLMLQELRANFVYTAFDKTHNQTAKIISTNTEIITSNQPNRFGINIGYGLNWFITDNATLGFNYEYGMKKDFKSHTAYLNFRLFL